MLSDKNRAEVQAAVRDHERHCDQHWADMIWDLAMRFGMEDEEMEEVANNFVGT